jgi:hypothetical protein
LPSVSREPFVDQLSLPANDNTVDEQDFEGTLVLEKLAQIDQLDARNASKFIGNDPARSHTFIEWQISKLP